MAAEFNGKRLELLREIIPELRRVAIVANPQHPASSSSAPTPKAQGDSWA